MMRWWVMLGGALAIAAALWLMRRAGPAVHDTRMGAMFRPASPVVAYFLGILLLLAGIMAVLFGWFVV